VKVRIYVEGGGDSRTLNSKCREGFRKLLEKAGFKGRMPRITACGSRESTFEDFQTALSDTRGEAFPILLVDSEGPVNSEPWQHWRDRDGWIKPVNADNDQAQLMVQCMETWCVADREALQDFFGNRLHERSLPPDDNLETRTKDDVQTALERATHPCGRDREYKKGVRSFELLACLNPARLQERLPHFLKLCDALDRRL
jgi:hypothetical protein